MTIHWKALLVAIATLLVIACASPQVTGPSKPPEANAANAAEQRRDWAQAARLWLEAADSATAGQASTYRLNAAVAWLNANQANRSRDLLRLVDEAQLDSRDRGRLALIYAELALESGDAERAEFYLQAARPHLDSSLQQEYQQLSRELEALLSDPDSQALAQAARLIADMTIFDSGRALEILQRLEPVPSGRLEGLPDGNRRLKQWAMVAVAVRRTLVGQQDLFEASKRWEATHPRHELSGTAFMELCWQYGQLFKPPARIAVLLPDEGNLAAAGQAIRDGLLSAFMDQPGGSELEFIAVADDPEIALATYRQTQQAGFDWMIGPLRRESVQNVADHGGGNPPGLLLNQFTPAPGQPLDYFGLSLSQSLEAASLAELMLESGLRRTLVVVAEGAWGARVEAAFVQAYKAGEGEIVAVETFNTADADHSGRLTSLLKIEDSRQRKDSLQAALSLPLGFEPTRRDDFDAIFMAADPRLGRQLKPQLRFFDAGSKPVYAMSRIFSGHVDQAADQDLNGVVFATTRWSLALEDPSESFASLRGGAFGSLFALGKDAWNVLPWLDLLQKDPDLIFAGAVGQLRLGDSGELEREPVWARFSRGRPVEYLPPAPQ
jgi:outer membrane PBP1 activator LpoA protein